MIFLAVPVAVTCTVRLSLPSHRGSSSGIKLRNFSSTLFLRFCHGFAKSLRLQHLVFDRIRCVRSNLAFDRIEWRDRFCSIESHVRFDLRLRVNSELDLKIVVCSTK